MLSSNFDDHKHTIGFNPFNLANVSKYGLIGFNIVPYVQIFYQYCLSFGKKTTSFSITVFDGI